MYICATFNNKEIMKKGTKVTNQYGDKLTVLEVIDNKTVRTYEDFNNLYHITKLFIVN
jgi:hypothetical protein